MTTPAATAETAETKLVQKPAETAETKPAETAETKPAETTASAGTTQLSRAVLAKPYVNEFGAKHGLTLFAAHETIEAARVEFCKILQAENKTLAEANGKFAKAPQGETPASFSGGDTKPANGKFANLGESLGKFAAGIRIPGKKYE